MIFVVTRLEGLLQNHAGKVTKEEIAHGQHRKSSLETDSDNSDDTDQSDCETDMDEPYEVESDETASSQDEEEFVGEEIR